MHPADFIKSLRPLESFPHAHASRLGQGLDGSRSIGLARFGTPQGAPSPDAGAVTPEGMMPRVPSVAIRSAPPDKRSVDFLATVAHELRNTLAPLQLRAALLRRSRDEAVVLQSLDTIDRQVALMVVLVNDLLEFSRLTVGKFVLSEELTTLQALAAAAFEGSRALVEAAGQRFVLDCTPEPLPVRVDPRRVQQILANLLGNAVKFTPEGGRIVLSVTREGGAAVLRVIDTGVGISEEALPRVFEMFSQCVGTLDRSRGGLGIGLAVAKQLVELQGGTLQAESAGRGRGSVFTVRLPLTGEDERIEEPKEWLGVEPPLSSSC